MFTLHVQIHGVGRVLTTSYTKNRLLSVLNSYHRQTAVHIERVNNDR